MLFTQLHETESLHAISDALLDEDFQKVLGFRSISASQLSRKNNDLDPSVLATIFLDLVHQIHQHHHRMKRVMPLKIIDSTTLPLNLTHYKRSEERRVGKESRYRMSVDQVKKKKEKTDRRMST